MDNSDMFVFFIIALIIGIIIFAISQEIMDKNNNELDDYINGFNLEVKKLYELQEELRKISKENNYERLLEKYKNFLSSYDNYCNNINILQEKINNTSNSLNNKRILHNLVLGGAKDVSAIGYYSAEKKYNKIISNIDKFRIDQDLMIDIKIKIKDM